MFLELERPSPCNNPPYPRIPVSLNRVLGHLTSAMVLILPIKAAVRFDMVRALGEWLDNDEQQVSYQRRVHCNW
jgi:hypothetical protein